MEPKGNEPVEEKGNPAYSEKKHNRVFQVKPNSIISDDSNTPISEKVCLCLNWIKTGFKREEKTKSEEKNELASEVYLKAMNNDEDQWIKGHFISVPICLHNIKQKLAAKVK